MEEKEEKKEGVREGEDRRSTLSLASLVMKLINSETHD